MSSEERKACIVDAACKLFAEKGFRGTTTRELAAAVGVTEPVLYEHFRTKRDLYSAIIEAKAQDGFKFLRSLSDAYNESKDDTGFFTALGNQIIEWYTKDPDFVRLLLFSNLENHELKDLFHERSSTCMGEVSGYIARRCAQGAMRAVDAEVAARAFFGMVAHYALTGLVFGYMPSSTPPKEVVSEMVGIFLGGLLTQDSFR
jgi:AcrR family transcriptional regulator